MDHLPDQAAEAEVQRRIRLEEIFLPHTQARRKAFFDQGAAQDGPQPSVRFVHYTSAEAAVNIIRSKKIWIRNATCMNDFLEVNHGFNILNRYFSDNDRKGHFYSAMDSVIPGVAQKAIERYDPRLNELRYSSYIFSISEHDPREDTHGRLSMWRAFGGHRAQVALVFRVPWKTDSNFEKLRLIFSPVSYPSPSEEFAPLDAAIKNIAGNIDFLREQGEVELINNVFHMLLTHTLCTKHQGFLEEREWRAIYCPDTFPSDLMTMRVEIIGGIPQPVYLIPLDHPDIPLLHPANLFDRLIIGPSEYPVAMHKAFVTEMNQIGIANAVERVVTSGIPLRVRPK